MRQLTQIWYEISKANTKNWFFSFSLLNSRDENEMVKTKRKWHKQKKNELNWRKIEIIKKKGEQYKDIKKHVALGGVELSFSCLTVECFFRNGQTG